MSAKPVSEASGKSLLSAQLCAMGDYKPIKTATVTSHTNWETLASEHPWLLSTKLVAKPDQLIKRRGKLGLIKVNATLDEARQWVTERMGKEISIGAAKGNLTNFILEPFVPHEQSDEYYLSIYSSRHEDTILFHHEGGVDVGDVDAKGVKLNVKASESLKLEQVVSILLFNVPEARKKLLAQFISHLYTIYRAQYFTYLEINPVVIVGESIYLLDLAAKLDQTAEYLCHSTWGHVSFPPPFGREMSPEENYVRELDSKSGASLKLTILNPKGRIWTMVAGGGASVIYSDTICDLGGSAELANYGEYSGAPSESQTYEYARTLLRLMTRELDPRGKVLIIGGGIANFTNVAATFQGISRALTEFVKEIKEHHVKIYVRRGGPNYQEGLRAIRELATKLALDMYVYGPETHMTAICAMALGRTSVLPAPNSSTSYMEDLINTPETTSLPDFPTGPDTSAHDVPDYKPLFSNTTRAFLYGVQPKAVQGMLDFDFCCGRKQPSVAGMIYPFSGNHTQKFYWGKNEILVPVYEKMAEAMATHPDVDVLINFASLRSAFDSTMETMSYPQIRTIAIIAEGIPENKTRELIIKAHEKNISIVGPATVGGIKPGCFKIGNTGGMIDNILASRLYRPGSVAYVSRSGGMSNELNNIVSRNSNGVFEGVAIGGDRYPGTTFVDHMDRYQKDPHVKMIVLLGEVGGVEEYEICERLRDGRLTKPVVAWCIGTCASYFASEVQFGHAGACANADRETAVAKNKALKEAGAFVPESFDSLDSMIRKVYLQLVHSGNIKPGPEPPRPKIPIDYAWAQELGLIRKPANFVSSISDERGEELLYAGMSLTDVFNDDIGIGGVISLLWFQRRLPAYCCKFFEMSLIVTADHGPAVSGAHNTIVTTRAGKDLVSSLCSGLLTIGDRFGGALDEAAKQFSEAFMSGQSPKEFMETMRKQHKYIMGIGHRVKSSTNPDMRVTIIKEFAKQHLPRTPLLDYALEVEKLTTAKKPNLILNVDGAIAVCFVDMLSQCGAFTREEVNEYVQIGVLNGLFVLGRTTGFIGHYLDQKRLKQGLYRHPWDDISYINSREGRQMF